MPGRKMTLPTRKTAFRLLSAVALATVASAMVGCSSDRGSPTDSTASTEHAGSIGLDLQLAPGFTLNSVSYAITGPSGFAKAGTIDVSNSTKISALLGPLPTGKGYSVTLSASSVQGLGTCGGSASFDIVAGKTTPVTVKVTCHEADRSGNVLINGQLNVCPVIDGLSASPGEVAVGGSIALAVAAHDSDAAPSALAYNWTASSGSLSSDSVASPTFTCKSAGVVTLNVTVSDGDTTPGCADSGSFKVQCSTATATSCSDFDSITAALGELTVDCRGTIDPNDYSIGQDGRLRPNFEACPSDERDPRRSHMVRILQMLALQHASDLPNVVECTAGRFKKLKDKFAERGISTCPTWSNKKVLNPITRDVLAKLAPLYPDLGEEETPVTLKGGFVPPPELAALKVKSTYTVSLPPGTSQQCATPAACATACAEVFPGFVIPPPAGVPAPPEDTIMVDPDSWWGAELFEPMANPDPNNMDAQFYHQMGFVLPTPGAKYGALERWNPCSTPIPTAPAALTATTVPGLDPSCFSEKCNYYAGGGVDNPVFIKTKLQKWCVDPTGADTTTCLSYCGTKPPPPAF
jgi:hypothetical protein